MSCFDQEDTGDNWKVECIGNEKQWMRNKSIRFKHMDTGKYLTTTSKHVFRNPIPGQLEVSCAGKSGNAVWSAKEGIYFSSLTL